MKEKIKVMKKYRVQNNLILISAFIIISELAFAQTLQQRTFLNQFSKEQNEIWLVKKAFADSIARLNNIPIYREYNDGSILELQEYTNGQYIYHQTDNQIAAQTISTDKVYTNVGGVFNLSGHNQKFGLWEAGGIPLLTHQEYSGRISVKDGSSSVTQHATHVAGTLIGSGIQANARGMSFLGNIDSYSSSNDLSEISSAAANGLRVSNHSYGQIVGWRSDYFGDGKWAWFGNPAISPVIDYQFGYYNSSSNAWDNMLFTAPYLLVTKSSGNDRGDGPSPGTEHWVNIGGTWTLSTDTRELDGGTTGYDCINDPRGIAKNTLTVGAINDIPNGYTGPSSVIMSSFSNWGPTDDGRIKPDIVANGVGLYSASNGSNSSYESLSGTSMSTPNAAGSIGLLLQLRDSLYSQQMPFLASTLKALLIHTSDEAGLAPGPDYVFGWGLMNTLSAALLLKLDAELGKFVLIKEDTLLQGNQFIYQYSSNGLEPLKFTINWFDRPGTPAPISLNPPNKMLVNDLDIRVIGPNSFVHLPWILDRASPSSAAINGDNITDNTEQIIIVNPFPGNYTVTISHKGSLMGGQQIFSMVASGVNVDLPSSTSIIYPANGSTGVPTITDFKWSVANKAVAYEYQISDDSLFTNIISSEKNIKTLSITVSNILGLDTLYWRVRGLNSGGSGAWSSVAMFTTIVSPPNIPSLIYPEQNSTHLLDSLICTWDQQANCHNYQFQLATNLLFTSIIRNDSGITVPNHNVQNLNEGFKYYWRVRAINEAGISNYSSRYNFSTKLKMPDSLKVNLVSSSSAALSWIDKSNSETKYVILRAVNNGEFQKLDSVGSNITTYTDNPITNLADYYYKIYAANNTALSDTTESVVLILTNIEDEMVIKDFSLSQNYPNPFNPSTTFEFTLPVNASIKLTIYNLLGQTVKTIFDGEKEAGHYKLNWNSDVISGNFAASGTYFYELSATGIDGKEFNRIMKMILMK